MVFLILAALTLSLIGPAHAQAVCGETFTVRRGDTLSGIAQLCNTTVAALLDANPDIDDPDFNLPRHGS